MKQKYMVRQVQEALQDQLRIGENRHKAKQAEATHAPPESSPTARLKPI